MNRREFLRLAGLSAVSGVSILSGCAPSVEPTATPSTLPGNAARLSLRIAPVKLELSPNQIIQTVGYNGSTPGPLLRVKEGQQVTVNVRNDTDVPELVHWHGFYVPSEVEALWKRERRWLLQAPRGNILSRRSRAEAGGITPTPLPAKICAAVFTLDNLVSSILSPRAIQATMIKKFFSRRISGSRTSSACKTSERGRRLTTAWKSCIGPLLSTTKPSVMASRSE